MGANITPKNGPLGGFCDGLATNPWKRRTFRGITLSMTHTAEKNTVLEKDVAIIGAGPCGLFAVFECGMLGLSTVVFDSLPAIGGQCTALYPEKPIYDIPAAPAILAGDLIANLEQQAAPFHPVYALNQQIVSLSKENGLWTLTSNTGQIARVKAVIIAAGAGAFGPNRPPLDGIEGYEGTGVQYMVRQKDAFRGKRIAIAGGGDSALDWAISLSPLTDKLYVIHRRDKFRAAPESVRQVEELAKAGRLELVVPYQLDSLSGSNGILDSLTVSSLDGEKRVLEIDCLLAFFGLAASLGPIAEWGLALDQHHIVVDPATSETSQSAIYAIGDIASYKNKKKLILTGFHEAAMAAHAIRAQLFPDQAFHFEYSTTKGVPRSA